MHACSTDQGLGADLLGALVLLALPIGVEALARLAPQKLGLEQLWAGGLVE